MLPVTTTPCPGDEQLVGFAEGLLESDARRCVAAHLDDCEDCRVLVGLAGEDGTPGEDGPMRQVAEGSTAGRYVVVRKVGEGAMGMVFAARDPELGRTVALKVLRTNTRDDPHGRKRILREAQALARLSHPNIVSVFDVGELEDDVFIAMEFVDGPTLGAWWQGRPWVEVVERFIEAGRGLEAAHQRGIVHRDFKPANVLIGGDQRARVSDFGLAAVHGGEQKSDGEASELDTAPVSTRLTQTGAMLGTPAYMAPEQLTGESATERSDQFAFFVSLHEALYGQRPFVAPTIPALLAEITRGPSQPRSRGAGVVPLLAALIRTGLQPDPDARHASMSTVVAGLERCLPRRGRRWGLVVTAVASVAAAGGMLWPSASAMCKGGDERFAERWNAPTRTDLRARLESSRLAEATAMAQAVDGRLDWFVDEWTTAHAEVCETAREDQTAPGDLDARMACLDRGAAAFDATVSVLLQPTTPPQEASSVAVGLPAPGRCTDADAVGAGHLPPADPELAGRLESELAEAEALRRALRFDDSLAQLDALRETWPQAEPSIRARQQYLRGVLLAALDQPEAARAQLQQAYEFATQSGIDMTAAHAAAKLMHLQATVIGDMQAADRWAPHARALSERIGTELARALYLKVHAEVLVVQSKTAEAVEEATVARELYVREGGTETPSVVTLDSLLGNVALLRRDFSGARRHFERALHGHSIVFGPAHPRIVSSLRGLTHVALAERDLDEAAVLLDAIEAVVLETYGPDHREHSITLSLRGMLAAVRGDQEAALEAHTAALEVQEATLSPQHVWVTRTVTRIGLAHLRLRNYAAALRFNTRALDGCVATLGPEATCAGVAHHNVGEAEAGLGHHGRAEEHYRSAIAILEHSNGSDTPMLGFPLTGLGEVLLATGRADEAGPVLRRALSLTGRHPDNEKEWAETAFALARAIDATGARTPQLRYEAYTLAAEAAEIFAGFEGFDIEHRDASRWLETL